MKLKFIFVDKTRAKWLVDGENEYLKRIRGDASLSHIIVDTYSKIGEPLKIINAQGEAILDKIKEKDFVCLLTSKGKQLTSREMSEKVDQWTQNSPQIVFVVGGSFGVSEAVKNRADFQLSFSKLTLTHEMIRVLLFEQIYRSLCILKNRKYHYGS